MSTETKEKGKHTPGPWRWLPDEGQFIVAANDYIVAEIPCQGSNPADGEFIVRAVNAHEELLEALKMIVEHAWEFDSQSRICVRFTPAEWDEIQAALALAEGRE